MKIDYHLAESGTKNGESYAKILSEEKSITKITVIADTEESAIKTAKLLIRKLKKWEH